MVQMAALAAINDFVFPNGYVRGDPMPVLACELHGVKYGDHSCGIVIHKGVAGVDMYAANVDVGPRVDDVDTTPATIPWVVAVLTRVSKGGLVVVRPARLHDCQSSLMMHPESDALVRELLADASAGNDIQAISILPPIGDNQVFVPSMVTATVVQDTTNIRWLHHATLLPVETCEPKARSRTFALMWVLAHTIGHVGAELSVMQPSALNDMMLAVLAVTPITPYFAGMNLRKDDPTLRMLMHTNDAFEDPPIMVDVELAEVPELAGSNPPGGPGHAGRPSHFFSKFVLKFRGVSFDGHFLRGSTPDLPREWRTDSGVCIFHLLWWHVAATCRNPEPGVAEDASANVIIAMTRAVRTFARDVMRLPLEALGDSRANLSPTQQAQPFASAREMSIAEARAIADKLNGALPVFHQDIGGASLLSPLDAGNNHLARTLGGGAGHRAFVALQQDCLRAEAEVIDSLAHALDGIHDGVGGGRLGVDDMDPELAALAERFPLGD